MFQITPTGQNGANPIRVVPCQSHCVGQFQNPSNPPIVNYYFPKSSSLWKKKKSYRPTPRPSPPRVIKIHHYYHSRPQQDAEIDVWDTESESDWDYDVISLDDYDIIGDEYDPLPRISHGQTTTDERLDYRRNLGPRIHLRPPKTSRRRYHDPCCLS